jgi:hypothetical protein
VFQTRDPWAIVDFFSENFRSFYATAHSGGVLDAQLRPQLHQQDRLR